MSNKTLGDQGETCAVEYLRRQGCHILTRNYRTKLGEIDIIADDHGTLVFIEVKNTPQFTLWSSCRSSSL